MRKLNSYDASRMAANATESLNDICSIHTPSKTMSSLGEQITTWATATNISCGFNPSNAYKSIRGEVITLDCDAILRLPLSQNISIEQEITVNSNRYKIQGITTGRTVKIVPLKRVDTNG